VTIHLSVPVYERLRHESFVQRQEMSVIVEDALQHRFSSSDGGVRRQVQLGVMVQIEEDA
jgi:hypothetical protein